MKRCPTCGMLYSDMVTECPTCKIRLGDNSQPSPRSVTPPVTPPVETRTPATPPVQTQPPVNYVPSQPVTPPPAPVANIDKGGFLWYLPGLLMPIAGLIVGLCVKKKKPNCANAAFKGAGIGFFANILLTNITKFL